VIGIGAGILKTRWSAGLVATLIWWLESIRLRA